MIAKTTKRSKYPEWSVYVVIETEGYEGRVLVRQPKSTKYLRHIKAMPVVEFRDYMYLNVTKMFKKKGVLYIVVGKGKKQEIHMHDASRVRELWKREYKREGVQ